MIAYWCPIYVAGDPWGWRTATIRDIVKIWNNALLYTVFIVHFGKEENRSFQFF
jgi:hypothetical protein